MRKFKRRSPRALPFHLFLILTGALLLLAAFAPRANADCPACIRFYDFEGTPFPNLESHPPALETGAGTNLTLSNGAGGPYPPGNIVVGPPLGLNYPPPGPGGTPLPNTMSLGIRRSSNSNLALDMPFFSATGIYNITSVSFAYGANGNGYSAVQLFVSLTGPGGTFIPQGGPILLPATPGAVVSIPVITPTLGSPQVVVRLLFTGGQSNGNDLQNEIDNIQVNGSIIPEPATIAGGLLGVLGLCWFQRRRLIRQVRFRRT